MDYTGCERGNCLNCSCCYWFLNVAAPPNGPRFSYGLCQECGCRPAMHVDLGQRQLAQTVPQTATESVYSQHDKEVNGQVAEEMPRLFFMTEVKSTPSILADVEVDENYRRPGGGSWFKNLAQTIRLSQSNRLSFKCRHCQDFTTLLVDEFHEHIKICFEKENNNGENEDYCEMCPLCNGLCFDVDEMMEHFPLCQKRLAYELSLITTLPQAYCDDEGENGGGGDDENGAISSRSNDLYKNFEKLELMYENEKLISHNCVHCKPNRKYPSPMKLLSHLRKKHAEFQNTFAELCPLCSMALTSAKMYMYHYTTCWSVFKQQRRQHQQQQQQHQQ